MMHASLFQFQLKYNSYSNIFLNWLYIEFNLKEVITLDYVQSGTTVSIENFIDLIFLLFENIAVPQGIKRRT